MTATKRYRATRPLYRRGTTVETGHLLPRGWPNTALLKKKGWIEEAAEPPPKSEHEGGDDA